MRTHGWEYLVAISISCVLLSTVHAAAAGDGPGGEWLEGALHLVLGTPSQGVGLPPLTTANLLLDNGGIVAFALSSDQLREIGGPVTVNGRRARVLLPVSGFEHGSLTPLAIELATPRSAEPDDVTGSQPWVSILCKFSDKPSEPQDLAFFENMYASTFPGLDDYWRAQSYDLANVVGSAAVGWFTLPHTQQYYLDLIGTSYYEMLGELYDDCTGAAGGSVNLNDFVGVNLMFNDHIGDYAWGGFWGGRRVTWEPPWGWENVAVMGHEMGHGFGLPHSNNADNDGDPYDNPWDVMSNSWSYALHHGTYGTVGKHTISYHKDILGWIGGGRRVEVASTGLETYTIDHLTLAETSNLHLVKVWIPSSSRFYTVEVRDLVGYDGALPGFAVIIHEVDPSREEPAWLVDLDNPSNGADAGAMWLPGECFEDQPNRISICVESVTAEGYRVEIGYGAFHEIFDDDFETGGAGSWSETVP